MSNQNVVGILGAGRIARVHADALVKFQPGVRIKHIIDPYLTEEAAAWAKSIGVEHVSKESEDLFTDPEVDSVFICSPTPTHCDFIMRACEVKKNIYCEKPLAADIPSIHKAIAAIEKSGVKFLMGFMRRFDDNQMKLRAAIENGTIGDPQIIKLCSRDPEPPPYAYIETSGGLYFDSMIHDFDLARYYSDSEVEEVYALGVSLVDPKIGELGDVDTAIVSLKFASGAIGVIDLSRKSNSGYEQRTEVHGSKGCVSMGNVPESTIQITNDSGVLSDKPVYFFLERYEKAFVTAQAAFFATVNEGKPAPVTAFDGLQAVRLAKAAQKSKDEARPVLLSEID
ncbi:MAG: inositol 2-dehydrogenase [Christensenellales bacterium]|jgi:myo-inositol 2-dehydrogenase/D-chiro-inositol 1-dehydrogenase